MDMILIYNFVIELLTVGVIAFALRDLFAFMGDLISTIRTDNKWLKLPILFLSYVLTCSDKCAVFWFTLIYTQDLLMAAITSLVISTISKRINDKGTAL